VQSECRTPQNAGMQRRRINALCIQEMKWTGQSAKELGDGYKVFSTVAAKTKEMVLG